MSYGQGQIRTEERMGKDGLQARMGKDGLGARVRMGKDNDGLGQLQLDANSSM